ncbi:MAG TPA: DNA polymerase III subunit gamma/tau [Desulfobulbus sp.]|nr:DNA polymerase III subunit gamma/tau [Desulfobulbus sp.]
MSYLVLARKSRPRTFDEVVGQKIIVRTLQNALAAGRVPHGLIFSGIRGTGKTTLARIMAKALNCEQGPTPTPCNTCSSCRDIGAGTSVDLHEIDGASNRGIQEIRDLKENIRFMPTSARFKIIIIDEVHMLTSEAFNALLKTLEEPPDHVYFMFATTELHKVPVTILSRCQRYELQRVGRKELAAHYTRLAESEGIAIEPAAVDLIVREAAGSVRDGLSLLDQVFSYCGDEVKAEEVAEVLGLVSGQVIADLGEALLAGDISRAMEQLDQVYGYGMNIKRFTSELLSWFRHLIFCCLNKDPGRLLDLPQEDIARFSEIAGQYPLPTIYGLFNILLEGLERAHYSSQPRLAIEMAFIGAVQVGDVQPVSELLVRLDKILAGAGQEIATISSSGPGRKKKADQPAPLGETPEKARPEKARMEFQVDPVKEEKTEQIPEQKTQPPPAADVDEKKEHEKKERGRKEQVEAAKEDTLAGTNADAAPSDGPPSGEKAASHAEKEPDPVQHTTLGQREIKRRWPAFIDYVRDRKPWMAATLQKAVTVTLENEELIIHYDESADCNLLKNQEHIRPLTEFALDFFQQPLTLAFSVSDAGSCEVDPNGAVSPKVERKALARDPLVLDALEVFNGQVGAIRVGPRFRGPVGEGLPTTGEQEKK